MNEVTNTNTNANSNTLQSNQSNQFNQVFIDTPLFFGEPRRLDYSILSGDFSQILFHDDVVSYRVFFLNESAKNGFLEYHNEKNIKIAGFGATHITFIKDLTEDSIERTWNINLRRKVEIIPRMGFEVTPNAVSGLSWESQPQPQTVEPRIFHPIAYIGKWFRRDDVIIQPIERSQCDDESMYCKYFQLRSFDNEDWSDQEIIGYADFALFRKIDEKIRKVTAVDEEYIIDTFKEISSYEAEHLFDEWLDLQYNELFSDDKSEE